MILIESKVQYKQVIKKPLSVFWMVIILSSLYVFSLLNILIIRNTWDIFLVPKITGNTSFYQLSIWRIFCPKYISIANWMGEWIEYFVNIVWGHVMFRVQEEFCPCWRAATVNLCRHSPPPSTAVLWLPVCCHDAHCHLRLLCLLLVVFMWIP